MVMIKLDEVSDSSGRKSFMKATIIIIVLHHLYML